MADPPPIGARIREARLEAGDPVEALALELGRTAQTVNLWERGRVTPRVDTLARIAARYGKSLSDLTGGAELASQPEANR